MMTAFEPTRLSAARFLSAIARLSVDPPDWRWEYLHFINWKYARSLPGSKARPAPARTDQEHDQGAQAREPEQIADVSIEAAARQHRQVDQQGLRRGRRQLGRVDGFGPVSQAAGSVDVRGNPGVHSPDHLDPVLDRSEHGQREMLVRLGGAAEPGVVGDVDESIGIELRHAPS